MTPTRVLVLDGHTNQALACVRALGRAGHAVFVASPDRWPVAAWSRYCRGHVRVAAETPAGFAALRRWAREHRIAVVLPMGERSSLLCDMGRAAWEELGIALGCASAEVLLRAFDKARTLEYAEAVGLRIPPTRRPNSLAECHTAAEELGYPCILKPRFSDYWDGRGFVRANGVRYVRDAHDLCTGALACRQGELWPLVQGVVPGQGKGVFALCHRGEPIVWFGHERLRDVRPSGSGSSLRRSVALDPRLREPAARLLSAIGWHGPAMVEFRDDGGDRPWLMEVNGRFWGSLEVAIASGVDFPTLWVGLLRGEQPALPTAYIPGVTVRWLWGDVKRLLYILAGPPPGYAGPYPGILQGLREVLGPQPPGTRSETWRRDDPWPAVGQWFQGVTDLLGAARAALARRSAEPGVAPLPARDTPTSASRATEQAGAIGT